MTLFLQDVPFSFSSGIGLLIDHDMELLWRNKSLEKRNNYPINNTNDLASSLCEDYTYESRKWIDWIMESGSSAYYKLYQRSCKDRLEADEYLCHYVKEHTYKYVERQRNFIVIFNSSCHNTSLVTFQWRRQFFDNSVFSLMDWWIGEPIP